MPSNFANLIGNEDMISVVEDAASNKCPVSNPSGASIFDVLLTPLGIFVYGAAPKILNKWRECYKKQKIESAKLRSFARPMGLDPSDEMFVLSSEEALLPGNLTYEFFDPFSGQSNFMEDEYNNNDEYDDEYDSNDEYNDGNGDDDDADGNYEEKESKRSKGWNTTSRKRSVQASTENYYFEQYIGTREAHNKDSVWSDIKRKFGLMGYGMWGVSGDSIEDMASIVQPPGQRAWGNTLRQMTWFTSKEFLNTDVLTSEPLLAHYLLYLQDLGFYVKFFNWGPLSSPISFFWPPPAETLETLLMGRDEKKSGSQDYISKIYNNGYRRFIEVSLNVTLDGNGPFEFVDGKGEDEDAPPLDVMVDGDRIRAYNGKRTRRQQWQQQRRRRKLTTAEQDQEAEKTFVPHDCHETIRYYPRVRKLEAEKEREMRFGNEDPFEDEDFDDEEEYYDIDVLMEGSVYESF